MIPGSNGLPRYVRGLLVGKRVAEEQGSSVNNASGRKSGRTVFDDTGQGVWEWQTATGVFERNVTEEQLRGLEARHLALVEPAAVAEGRVWSTQPSSSKPSSRAARPSAAPRQGGALTRFLRRITGLN